MPGPPLRPGAHRGHPPLRRRAGLDARCAGCWPGSPPDPSPPTSPSASSWPGPCPAPTTLIPNGVAGRPQAPLDAPVVVMLQRLDQEKAPDVGIRAWAASGPWPTAGWRLVVAGSGRLRADLEELAEQLGCSGQRRVRRPGGRHRRAPRQLVGTPGPGAGRALRTVGGRGHVPRVWRWWPPTAAPTSRRWDRPGSCSPRGCGRRGPGPDGWPTIRRAARPVGAALRLPPAGALLARPPPRPPRGALPRRSPPVSQTADPAGVVRPRQRSSGATPVRRGPAAGRPPLPRKRPTVSVPAVAQLPTRARARPGHGPAPRSRATGSPGGTSRPGVADHVGQRAAGAGHDGTPDACASTTTRPNCSSQPGLGTEGTASTSKVGKTSGSDDLVDVAVEGHPVGDAECGGQGRERVPPRDPAP